MAQQSSVSAFIELTNCVCPVCSCFLIVVVRMPLLLMVCSGSVEYNIVRANIFIKLLFSSQLWFNYKSWLKGASREMREKRFFLYSLRVNCWKNRFPSKKKEFEWNAIAISHVNKHISFSPPASWKGNLSFEIKRLNCNQKWHESC